MPDHNRVQYLCQRAFSVDLGQSLDALDATSIYLCFSEALRAPFRSDKVPVHKNTLLGSRGKYLATFLHIVPVRSTLGRYWYNHTPENLRLQYLSKYRNYAVLQCLASLQRTITPSIQEFETYAANDSHNQCQVTSAGQVRHCCRLSDGMCSSLMRFPRSTG